MEDGKRGAEAKSAGPARRSAPPVELPPTVSRSTSSPSGSVKTLQVALTDLGFFSGRVDGWYSQKVRNAVSKFQIALRDHGYFDGLPNGVYNRATFEAAQRDPAFDIA